MDVKVVLSTIWAAVQPLLGKLMQDPAFQDVLQKILADVLAKITSGIHPDAVVKQAQGQIVAAAALHLTGNPIADAHAWVANLKLPPPTDLPPAPPPIGQYKS